MEFTDFILTFCSLKHPHWSWHRLILSVVACKGRAVHFRIKQNISCNKSPGLGEKRPFSPRNEENKAQKQTVFTQAVVLSCNQCTDGNECHFNFECLSGNQALVCLQIFFPVQRIINDWLWYECERWIIDVVKVELGDDMKIHINIMCL